MARVIISLLFVFVWQPVLTGKVEYVSDGDTINVRVNGDLGKIRLYGIDCPEIGHRSSEPNQEFGMEAKEFTESICAGTNVSVQTFGEDRYGRKHGIVILSDGRILNEELLKAGLAWHYTRYDQNKEWGQMQVAAKKAKKGLWGSKDPMAPWDFRKINR